MSYDISEAVIVWTGFEQASYPIRVEQRLVDRFGADAVAELMPRVRELESDFYSSETPYQIADLAEVGAAAAAEFQRKHPDVSTAAVAALTWCFTFDWK
jgi:hypothetical protein